MFFNHFFTSAGGHAWVGTAACFLLNVRTSTELIKSIQCLSRPQQNDSMLSYPIFAFPVPVGYKCINKLCAKDQSVFSLSLGFVMLSLLSLLAQLLFRVLKVYLIVVCQVCCYLQLWNMFRLGTIKVFKHYCSRLDSFIGAKGNSCNRIFKTSHGFKRRTFF